MFKGSPYYTSTDEVLNSVQFQFSLSPDFSTIELDKVQDVENLYGSTGSPWHTPIDLNEGKDITCFTVEKNKLKMVSITYVPAIATPTWNGRSGRKAVNSRLREV